MKVSAGWPVERLGLPTRGGMRYELRRNGAHSTRDDDEKRAESFSKWRRCGETTYEKVFSLAQIFCVRDGVGMDFLGCCPKSNRYPQPDPFQQCCAV